jgi:SAM-dependent methyltransferase
MKKITNIDSKVVEDFGREWETFNQEELPQNSLEEAFNQYFHIFPFKMINKNSVGFDMGCGSGRWAKLIAPKVKQLNCIDASKVALEQAKTNLVALKNCVFEVASVSDSALGKESQDFGYCLGVLHHIPDTLSGLKCCAEKLKSGAPFLLYLYYRFDNKPSWYRWVWEVSDIFRHAISPLPFPFKLFMSQLIAYLIYFPLSRLALLLDKLSFNVSNFPLSDYRKKPFYFLKTDALDRFGTRLEKRFTKKDIIEMMCEAGFTHISFSEGAPYWVAMGLKK